MEKKINYGNSTKKNSDYVDDKLFYESLVKRRLQIQESKKLNKEIPRASDYIGKCIMLICENMASRYNFNSYSYRDLMISKGIEDCVAAIDYFDTEKYNKPYSYFSRVAWRAFVRVIGDEHKQNYIKHKKMAESNFQNILLDNNYDNHQINEISENLEVSNQIINKFEQDLSAKKKEKSLKTQQNTITKFIEK